MSGNRSGLHVDVAFRFLPDRLLSQHHRDRFPRKENTSTVHSWFDGALLRNNSTPLLLRDIIWARFLQYVRSMRSEKHLCIALKRANPMGIRPLNSRPRMQQLHSHQPKCSNWLVRQNYALALSFSLLLASLTKLHEASSKVHPSKSVAENSILDWNGERSIVSVVAQIDAPLVQSHPDVLLPGRWMRSAERCVLVDCTGDHLHYVPLTLPLQLEDELFGASTQLWLKQVCRLYFNCRRSWFGDHWKESLFQWRESAVDRNKAHRSSA